MFGAFVVAFAPLSAFFQIVLCKMILNPPHSHTLALALTQMQARKNFGVLFWDDRVVLRPLSTVGHIKGHDFEQQNHNPTAAMLAKVIFYVCFCQFFYSLSPNSNGTQTNNNTTVESQRTELKID